MYGRADLARILLKHGALVEARDRYGVTPLLEAVITDQADVADVLLEHGADVDAESAEGVTPRALVATDPRVTVVLQRWIRRRAGEEPPAFEYSVCDSCGLESTKLLWCSRCRTVRYCSKDCQSTRTSTFGLFSLTHMQWPPGERTRPNALRSTRQLSRSVRHTQYQVTTRCLSIPSRKRRARSGFQLHPGAPIAFPTARTSSFQKIWC